MREQICSGAESGSHRGTEPGVGAASSPRWDSLAPCAQLAGPGVPGACEICPGPSADWPDAWSWANFSVSVQEDTSHLLWAAKGLWKHVSSIGSKSAHVSAYKLHPEAGGFSLKTRPAPRDS